MQNCTIHAEMSIIRSSFLLSPVNHTVILVRDKSHLKRFFNAILSCLLRACTALKSIVLYFVWWKESNVSENFEAGNTFAVKLSVFHGRTLVMRGGSRNVTGLTMYVEARCNFFLHTNHSFSQHLLSSDRKQNNRTWHKESERKEGSRKERKKLKQLQTAFVWGKNWTESNKFTLSWSAGTLFGNQSIVLFSDAEVQQVYMCSRDNDCCKAAKLGQYKQSGMCYKQHKKTIQSNFFWKS